jgi:trigger factor
MPGFRPGKVPANLIKQDAWRCSCMRKPLNDVVRESVDQLMKDKELRPAMQPKIELGEGYEEGKDAEIAIEAGSAADC